MKIKFLFFAIVFLVSVSCTQNNVFFQYYSMPENGWNKDSVYTFNIPITSNSTAYNVYINIRNTDKYKHQNLWLFLEETSPDKSIINDTIEFYLSDNHGKWLGSGISSIFEMPVLYRQNFKFNSNGTFKFKVKHGMRDTVLIGIKDLGIKVEEIK